MEDMEIEVRKTQAWIDSFERFMISVEPENYIEAYGLLGMLSFIVHLVTDNEIYERRVRMNAEVDGMMFRLYDIIQSGYDNDIDTTIMIGVLRHAEYVTNKLMFINRSNSEETNGVH